MTDKLAVVTGAGRGTGKAIALELARRGWRVVVVDINPDAAERVVEEIARAGGAAEAQVVDVSNKLAAQTMLYALLERGERIGLLVNAAWVTPGSSALKLDEWEWNRTLEVNLKGAFLMAQTAARAMRETGGGLILNVVRPVEASSHAAVRAARDGLPGLTAVLAAEWAPLGVRVEAVLSGVEPEVATAEAARRAGQP